MVAFRPTFLALLAAVPTLVSALTIAEIQGTSFQSPYAGKAVTDVPGVVTVKGPAGFWLRSTSPDKDDRTSESIYVFTGSNAAGKAILATVNAGDVLVVDGKVDEYRSGKDQLFLTELINPTNIRKTASGMAVEPLVLGKERSPPTEEYTSLDNGNVFNYPNNVTDVETVNPTLNPKKYGLDFWESLEGELVKVRKPVALGVSNQYGDVWVRGDWKVTGLNKRGGLTVNWKNKKTVDANPEAILIGSPLDGTKNDDTFMGNTVEEITGVVTYAFGFYRILPLTKLKVTGAPSPAVTSPTKLKSDGKCAITFGSYNVENMSPKSSHIPLVASQIITFMNSPDLLFIQEIQDNDGATQSPITSANATLSALTASISSQGGPTYAFLEVAPENLKDGGAPGGNIRTAYLYNPAVLTLDTPNPGTYSDKAVVAKDGTLSFNPGRIDPANSAWTATRKPLVALFKTVKSGKRVYAVNVHMSSKGGSSSLHGSARPPINGAIEARIQQNTVMRQFIGEVLKADKNANILASGDFNEFMQTPAFANIWDGVLHDSDEVVGEKDVERYSYVFDMNTQMLDHLFVSDRLSKRQGLLGLFKKRLEVEHVHINSWETYDARTSDHDPSVGRVNVCY
ncbi:endonuclease/exonuclease/phosphatase family protein [Ascobolus immersus RN42]|uniref:Endonuclease/exonuclease/phosphatase family protein n=1 Tax=Ascobolus immersus RN42 TaxID=1160509 RepID=A0A3N4HV43_ASCIM|nr:endonuclease/exonuclease/phosphatase family protein [Ascobolus immersus RN42]